ncbi:MAG: flagellar motor switch protein FliN [Bryobacteraceae bacterium]
MTVEKIIDAWLPSLAAVIEQEMGSKPVLARTATPFDAATLTWWQQSLAYAPGAIVWVGASDSTVADIVGKSLPSALGLSCESLVAAGSEIPSTIAALDVRLPGSSAFTVALGFNQELIEVLLGGAANGRTLDLILDVELPLTVSFGRTRMPLGRVLDLTAGAVVELNRFIEDPVDILVNGRVVARGEVVEVRGSYGVRITEIASRGERIESGSLPLGAAAASSVSHPIRIQ